MDNRTTGTSGARKCRRCNMPQRPGYYGWGAVVNGVPSHQGVCFRCGGSGLDPVQPIAVAAQAATAAAGNKATDTTAQARRMADLDALVAQVSLEPQLRDYARQECSGPYTGGAQ